MDEKTTPTQFMKDRQRLENFVGENETMHGRGLTMIDDAVIDAIRRVVVNAGALERELVDMVNQHCLRRDDGSIFAGGLSSNADAMLVLAQLGVIEITGGTGRCIYGKWTGWMRSAP